MFEFWEFDFLGSPCRVQRAIWISAVVFAVVGFASAVDFTTGYNICPYNCNGHGFCPVNDVQTCVCYEQWDEEAPDCSRRTCGVGTCMVQ